MRSTQSKTKLSTEETLSPGPYTVVSLHPIWAWAVIFAGKDVENRTWLTNQRGRVLIHASGRRMSLREDQELRAELSFLSGIARAALPLTLARCAILGSVEIDDCVEDARSKWAAQGKYHWLLREPRPLALPILDVPAKPELWTWTYAGEAGQRSLRAPAVSMVVPRGTLARTLPRGVEPAATAAPFDLASLEVDALTAALRTGASAQPANEVERAKAKAKPSRKAKTRPR